MNWRGIENKVSMHGTGEIHDRRSNNIYQIRNESIANLVNIICCDLPGSAKAQAIRLGG